MIHLLFTLIFSEKAVILLLIFRNPLRKLVILCLDRAKRGRGPIVIKTVAATLFVMLASTLYSIFEIRRRGALENSDPVPLAMNSTDQVLLAKHLLEATLMGFSLFLALIIDRLHHYIRELRMRRKNMDNAKKQSQIFEEEKLETDLQDEHNLAKEKNQNMPSDSSSNSGKEE